MPTKGSNTRREILQAAKALFMVKGFSATTMSDLCEVTKLSRGGLYRHFSSTKEVFVALLTDDKETWAEEAQRAEDAGMAAKTMLAYYLEQACAEIVAGEGRLSLATYEYAGSGQDTEGFLKARYEGAVAMMQRLLKYGQDRGEFASFDTLAVAEHLVIFMDGLRMAAAAIPLPMETIRRQLDGVLASIEKKEGA